MSSQETLPYIGSKISLISNMDLRYEGTLVAINTEESTASLRQVKSFGTEGRRHPNIPASPEIFEFIIFKGSDIKDLTVCETDVPNVGTESGISTVESHPQYYNETQRHGDTAATVPSPQVGTSTNDRGNHSVTGYSSIYTVGAATSPTVEDAAASYQMTEGRPAVVPSPKKTTTYQNTGFRNNYGYLGQQQNLNRASQQDGGNRIGGDHLSRRNRQIVGELASQPNPILKNELLSDFDFDGANAKFDKSVTNGATGVHHNNSMKNFGGYNKKSSFFDNISCESLDRKQGRDEKYDKEKQLQLDVDTFGDAAASYRGARFSYRRSRGRGGFRGRGTYNGGRSGYGRNRYYRSRHPINEL